MKKLALALAVTSFVAGTASADIRTGYYVGAGVGANSTNYGDSIGRHGMEGTVYGGYGFVTGCTYLGGELGYTFTGAKAVTRIATSERRNVFNAALLIGQKFTPSTMIYARLGLNYAQFKIDDKITGENESKRKFSFAPGIGLETAATKNIRVRLQYVYDLGTKFDAAGFKDVKGKTQAVTLGAAWLF